ncbi:MAG: bifunctional nuclease family protein [Flavobacteriales bacterium]|nr:bifunctional nuclease family protein [Flavobacteriales bacterium]MCW8914066.1 bifunctional nuclease family protein [Flavobacteriales bacterium]MCW8938124.1 bifunctional nuclease family protein [Flavobacteriales bacterium]MCW8939379.1 bifunctional nuclease family protein [Flavobacteriales bacterium]MCW8968900.1 bifunctional nuclease family protein [Flavobacteriales bacterium]
MDKIELEIIGLSYSQTQTGAYALVLGETSGNKRRLPIIIGGFEAQAIAIELEAMTPSRPLTHDLFKNLADAFEINLLEVIIYNLVEGIFYAKLIIQQGTETIEIDTRTSDAIALAVRFKCPISTYEFILSSAGIILDESQKDKDIDGDSDEFDDLEKEIEDIDPSKPLDYSKMSITELNKVLQNAIEHENYEEASKIKAEIDRRNAN